MVRDKITYQINRLDDKFILSIKNSNSKKINFGTIFVISLSIIMTLLPITTIAYLHIEISFGSILCCLVAFSISGYLLKIFLWNMYGKEVFIINKNNFTKYNDYRLFKDNFESLKFENIEASIVINNIFESKYRKDIILEYAEKEGILGFKLDDEIVLSHRKIKISILIEIIREIDIFLDNC